MYTAAQARETVKEYETHVKEKTLENLLVKEENQLALQLFENEIYNMASKGNTMLLINDENNELFKAFQSTDIKTILRFLGYSIDTVYGDYFKIKW